jgi:tRNA threonylcarbamoyladenosine biosynthesis protein TsaE
MKNYIYKSKSENDTKQLAKFIASNLNNGNTIVLSGDLGSGKTKFTEGFLSYFNLEDEISSPTFTIVNEYETNDNKKIFHFDTYRLEDSNEFIDSIGTDYFENGICIIEWGNIIKDVLPKNTVNIEIEKDNSNENIRIFKIWRD